tara:strand:+ start:84 stop:470 length:387 start_codon:yes stop_codon:yes gene_type:complete
VDKYRILGQEFPTVAGGWAKAYSVPVFEAVTVGSADVAPKVVSVQTQSLVTSIIVCATALSGKFSIGLTEVDGGSPVSKEILFSNRYLPKDSTVVLSLALTLSPANTIFVRSSVGSSLSYTIMGIEVI